MNSNFPSYQYHSLRKKKWRQTLKCEFPSASSQILNFAVTNIRRTQFVCPWGNWSVTYFLRDIPQQLCFPTAWDRPCDTTRTPPRTHSTITPSLPAISCSHSYILNGHPKLTLMSSRPPGTIHWSTAFFLLKSAHVCLTLYRNSKTPTSICTFFLPSQVLLPYLWLQWSAVLFTDDSLATLFSCPKIADYLALLPSSVVLFFLLTLSVTSDFLVTLTASLSLHSHFHLLIQLPASLLGNWQRKVQVLEHHMMPCNVLIQLHIV